MKKWLDELKKDKKKATILFIVLTLLVITILLTIFQGKTTEEPTENKMSDVIVPVDSTKVNNHTVGNNNEDFFNMEESNTEQTEVDNSKNGLSGLNNLVKNEPKQSGYYRPAPQKVSVRNEYYQPQSIPQKQQQPATELPSKKRRAPNDALGNMSGQSASGSIKSLYNCVMYNDSKVIRNGSYVTMRVAEDIIFDNIKIPKNTVVTGVASLNEERMQIQINSVKLGNQIKTVKWVIYDNDANLGVAIPQSVLTDISKDVADESLRSDGSKVDVNVPVVGNVKLNLQKRNKEVSFIVPNGHKLYIKSL